MSQIIKHDVTCISCGDIHTIEMTQAQSDEWFGPRHERRLIQRIFPEMSPGDREMLLSGICNDCFSDIAKDMEIEDAEERRLRRIAIKEWNVNRQGNRGVASKEIVCRCGKKTKFYAKGMQGSGLLCRDCYIDHQIGFNKR